MIIITNKTFLINVFMKVVIVLLNSKSKDCSDVKNNYECNIIILSETKRCYIIFPIQEFYKNCVDYK